MRRLEPAGSARPDFDAVPFKHLYAKETYEARTADGWRLCISRYRPLPQAWHQPIFGEPLLLVPGWSQNRHAFTSGKFVKHLLFEGADVHIVELRGHGLSSRERQLQAAQECGAKLPDDLDWGWDLDSYLLDDLPAAVQAVKAKTGRQRIYYLGHSMGGMLGYGYAAMHPGDLAGLATIGAPSDLGRGSWLLGAAALFGPALLAPLVDLSFAAYSSADAVRHTAASALRRMRWLRRAANRIAQENSKPVALRFSHVPVDRFLKRLSLAVTEENLRRFERVARGLNPLLNPARVPAEDFRWMLSQSGEKEPRRVIEQFGRWIRRDEMKCYRTGFDYKANFGRIEIPLAILYGDLDRIASRKSTRTISESARSDYLLWKPVKDNSHVELTLGHDIGGICQDVVQMVEYAARRERARLARQAAPPLRMVGANGVAG